MGSIPSALPIHGAPQMPMQLVSDLIDQHCRFSTDTLADAQARMRTMRDGVTLSIDRPENFVNYREVVLSIGGLLLTIGCINSRSGYDLCFKSGEEYIVTIPLRGSGWASTGGMFVEYSEGDVMIVAPMCRVEKHWEGPGEVLSIHIPADRFDAIVAELDADLLLSVPILRIDNRKLRCFVQVIHMICSDLRDGSGRSLFLRAPFSDQAERMLLLLLLEELRAEPRAVRHAVSTSPAIPYYVRRAEKFIAANAHLSVGIEEIADAAGVSTRTVQHGFRKFLSITPMFYLKRLRYDRARQMLLCNGGSRKISEIAVDVGCHNFSQFSREYRSQFGETPSNTLASPKGLVG